MNFHFQPDSEESVSASLDSGSPLGRRRRRRFGGAFVASLVIHGAALAAVVWNPARFFEFTGEDGGAPSQNLLNVSFSEPAPREDPPEVTKEETAPVRKIAPEFIERVTVVSVVAAAGQQTVEPFLAAEPLAFVTADALLELPPGYQPPAEPEPPALPPAPASAKPAASKSNTSSEPRPGSAGPLTEAKIKRRMGVRYPDDARREGVEGFCTVEIAINEKGKVTSAKISKSSGDARLDREALRAAKSATFHAARRGDNPVASRAKLPFKFVIQ